MAVSCGVPPTVKSPVAGVTASDATVLVVSVVPPELVLETKLLPVDPGWS